MSDRMIELKKSVEAIYFTALKLADPALRTMFLEQACAGDEEIRAMVNQLLASPSEDFFAAASPALELTAEDVAEAARENVFQESILADSRIGSRIGRYHLLEKIGEGGCGVVYMAEQESPIRRRVALKIIKPGMDTRSVIARFEAERQTLALMDHPYISKVLDAGMTQNERPFYVMELVDGLKITTFCDRHNLSARQRLDLFVGVCQAVQHAHQKGIIHRDIKPSNILVSLVDGKPLPQVIDFGIAKALQGQPSETTQFTRQEQWLGTPAYMSPEQAGSGGLDVDTRSDIYSLGVLLYELLTGQTPFDPASLTGSNLEDMRQKLREVEPPRPSARLAALPGPELIEIARHRQAESSQLLSQVRGDLDWIALRALEKDRTRRYATANDLAADVQHHLANEPVTARPPSQIYQFQKLVRRNWTLFVASVMVGVALLAGTGISTTLYFREKAAREEQVLFQTLVEEARAKEAHLLSQSEARERLARAAVFLSQDNVAEADSLLAQTPLDSIQPSMEAAGVLRAIGEWNASYNRWRPAADYFAALMQANQLDLPAHVAHSSDLLLPGPAWLELGDVTAYEQFRASALKRFEDCTNSNVAAEHIIKMSLLLPADAATLERLKPIGDTIARSLNTRSAEGFSAWSAAALALLDYRRGDFTNSLAWARQSLDFPDANAASQATVRCLMAMDWQRLGQGEAAHGEAEQALKLNEASPLKPGIKGNLREGFWYDWVVVRHLLLEYSKLPGRELP